MWVLDYMDDLESDFSVFHRVEDIHSLDGPRFFRLALRVFAYQGVMAARLAEEEVSVPRRARSDRPQRVDVSDLTRLSPGLIERTEV